MSQPRQFPDAVVVQILRKSASVEIVLPGTMHCHMRALLTLARAFVLCCNWRDPQDSGKRQLDLRDEEGFVTEMCLGRKKETAEGLVLMYFASSRYSLHGFY